MNERIKYLRKELLHLTLEEFGSHIGLGKSALSKIERGENTGTDQTVKSICREFGVREEWLRTGEGEPFGSYTRNEKVAEFANRVMKEEDENFKKRFISALAELNEEQWKVIEDLCMAATKKD